MTPKISVIVPVYNVRDYLEACVQSVRGQTLRDWELILVDDGSTDGSDLVCRDMAEEDPRIRVIRQPNGGVSAARNAGLDAALGEYVTFLDGDDAYDRDHLQLLFSLAEEAGTDIAATGMRTEDADGVVQGISVPVPGIASGKEDIFRQFLCNSSGLYSCANKLFRRAVIGGVRFRGYAMAEDALFCTEVLSRCSVCAAADVATYRYIKRPGSVTMNRFDRPFTDQFKAWAEIYDVLEREAPALCTFAAVKICHDIDKCYLPCREKKGADWKHCCAYMKAMRLRFFRLQFSGGKAPVRKLAADLLYRLSPVLYYKLLQGLVYPKEGVWTSSVEH